jgi:hypothetical protein
MDSSLTSSRSGDASMSMFYTKITCPATNNRRISSVVSTAIPPRRLAAPSLESPVNASGRFAKLQFGANLRFRKLPHSALHCWIGRVSGQALDRQVQVSWFQHVSGFWLHYSPVSMRGCEATANYQGKKSALARRRLPDADWRELPRNAHLAESVHAGRRGVACQIPERSHRDRLWSGARTGL